MARPVKKVKEKSREPETIKVSVEPDFSDLPEYVTLIGTEKSRYLKTGKEYFNIHNTVAKKLIKIGDATLKK